jgi:signal transduction histidine kinase
MPSHAISLKTQLLFTIVGSIVATAGALTTLAYRAQIVNLERDARRSVHMAAQSRAEVIVRVIEEQQRRAQGFLISAASLCGETTWSGRLAWELGCAQRALRELGATERTIGGRLANRRGRIAQVGAALPADVPPPQGLLPRLLERDGQMTYIVRAQDKDAVLRLQYALSDLSALFEQPIGLGAHGEVILHDSTRILLRPSRIGGQAGSAALGEWTHSCALVPSEWDDIDPRGVRTIHAVEPVLAFAQPMCVDAYVSHEEALSPAAALLVDLVKRAAIFSIVGVVLALIAAHWMSAPVQRLAASARALQTGEFTRPIPTSGPSEIRALGHAFRGMARELGEQMSRAQRARQEAETANHAKDEFLAVLSHELRTPLTATLGWTRLLRRKELDSRQTDRAVAAIERSAQMQVRLIEDLLDVSRIIAGRLHLERALVPVNEAVRVVLEELRPAAEDNGIVLDGHSEGAPSISADAVRLQQIVTNLVSNAIKFTPSGGHVTVNACEVDGYVEIVVADTGIGIAPEFLPHIFERFRQADAGPRRAYGGLGLGLSIVKYLVELHGGTVNATSMGSGFGATFEVRLPIAWNDVATAAQKRVDPHWTTDLPPAVPAPRLDTLHVLVVEDDEDTRHLVAAMLQAAGATVDAVANAAEGHQRLRTHRYSAIVCDLAMPHEDGYTFIRTVRAVSGSVPAVALTGLARREDASAAHAAGFQVYLTKPIDRDKLIAAIADLTLRSAS